MKLLFPSPRPAASSTESRNLLLSVGDRVPTGTDAVQAYDLVQNWGDDDVFPWLQMSCYLRKKLVSPFTVKTEEKSGYYFP